MSLRRVAQRGFRARVASPAGRRVGWLVLATLTAALVLRTYDVGASAWVPSAIAWFVAPLAALGSVHAAVGSDGLRVETARLAAFGAGARRSAVVLASVAIGTSAVVTGVTAALALALGHTYADPSLAVDLPITLLIGAAAGATLACVFLFTHTFRPFWRTAADLLVLIGGGLVSVTPQHLSLALLEGGGAVVNSASAILGAELFVVAACGLALALWRSRPRALALE